MRRNARVLIVIALIVAVCGTILGIQKIEFSQFERGGDTPLGLSLGLDLQGGSHLVYQAALRDQQTGEPIEVSEDQMHSLVKTIERRINSSGLGEPIIQILGNDRLLIQLPGVRDPGRAKTLIGETARLEFKHRSINVDPVALDYIVPEDVISITADDMWADGNFVSELTPDDINDQTKTLVSFPSLIVDFSEFGADKFQQVALNLSISIALSMDAAQRGDILPPDLLVVSVTGEEELRFQVMGDQIQRIATTTRYVIALPAGEDKMSGVITTAQAREKLGTNPFIKFELRKGYSDEDIGLSGDDLKNAYPSHHQGSGAPIVSIEFDDRGTKLFGELTKDIYAKQQETGFRDQIAIVLDGQELIAPVVNTPITAGTAIIQGPDFTLERVKDLSLLLESGRLPIPIELIQERDVDAILGADSLRKSVIAGMIGLMLVLLFMTLYYRIPGLVASIALIIYSMIVLAVFKILPVTLTLSGVAAAILSIGMAVDANILIFERMKDELRTGRTMLSAINIGFNRAWPAIRDGNVSTLITCAILYWFSDQLGATIVQGFAVTLAIGVMISMFSAIVVSRSLMRVLALTPIS
ncbi:MAG: protein translocase subunit SecD, partial [Chloroflexota bacterium]|nr:protein translocase subunit SecD [Chloroflexota bacterium]